MASKVEIANLALEMVAAREINSFTDGSVNASIIARWYPRTLRYCLNKSLWTFATKRVDLVATSDTIPWNSYGMDYSYAYPSDKVRIFGYSYPRARVREEATWILSDTDGLGCLYVYLNDNPETYTPEFEEALATKIAADIAFKVTTDESVTKAMIEKFQSIALPEALSVNSQNSTPTSVIDDEWLRVKNGAFSAYTEDLYY
jgi:hypothetical protein